MNPASALPGAVMIFFFLLAWAWSVWRITRGRWLLRGIHAMIAGLMLAGGVSVLSDDAALGVPVGMGLVLLALAVLLLDRARGRWLAAAHLLAGILLAADVPLV